MNEKKISTKEYEYLLDCKSIAELFNGVDPEDLKYLLDIIKRKDFESIPRQYQIQMIVLLYFIKKLALTDEFLIFVKQNYGNQFERFQKYFKAMEKDIEDLTNELKNKRETEKEARK